MLQLSINGHSYNIAPQNFILLAVVMYPEFSPASLRRTTLIWRLKEKWRILVGSTIRFPLKKESKGMSHKIVDSSRCLSKFPHSKNGIRFIFDSGMVQNMPITLKFDPQHFLKLKFCPYSFRLHQIIGHNLCFWHEKRKLICLKL